MSCPIKIRLSQMSAGVPHNTPNDRVMDVNRMYREFCLIMNSLDDLYHKGDSNGGYYNPQMILDSADSIVAQFNHVKATILGSQPPSAAQGHKQTPN
jgi:hypothetical protein